MNNQALNFDQYLKKVKASHSSSFRNPSSMTHLKCQKILKSNSRSSLKKSTHNFFRKKSKKVQFLPSMTKGKFPSHRRNFDNQKKSSFKERTSYRDLNSNNRRKLRKAASLIFPNSTETELNRMTNKLVFSGVKKKRQNVGKLSALNSPKQTENKDKFRRTCSQPYFKTELNQIGQPKILQEKFFKPKKFEMSSIIMSPILTEKHLKEERGKRFSKIIQRLRKRNEKELFRIKQKKLIRKKQREMQQQVERYEEKRINKQFEKESSRNKLNVYKELSNVFGDKRMFKQLNKMQDKLNSKHRQKGKSKSISGIMNQKLMKKTSILKSIDSISGGYYLKYTKRKSNLGVDLAQITNQKPKEKLMIRRNMALRAFRSFGNNNDYEMFGIDDYVNKDQEERF